MAQGINAFQYVSAADILSRLPAKDLLGLVVEGEEARRATLDTLAAAIEFAQSGIAKTIVQLLLEWTNDERFEQVANVVYTSNGFVESADVEWTDGSAGHFTSTTFSPIHGLRNGFEITHTDSGLVVVQPNVTRDVLEQITAQPPLQVVDSGLVVQEEDAANDMELLERKMGQIIRDEIVWAEGRANSYIGKVYALPAVAADDTVPSEVKDAVLTLAVRKIWGRRPNIPQEVMAAFDDSIKWLEQVARGRVVISMLDVTATTETRKTKAYSGSTTRTGLAFNSGW